MNNTAEVEPNPFVSAVRPLPDNIIPFPAPVMPERELSLNELLLAFHAGSPYMVWLAPDFKAEASKHIQWYCQVCGRQPKESAVLMTAQTIMCQSCHSTFSRIFTYTNQR